MTEENEPTKSELNKILEIFESKSNTFDKGFAVLVGLSLFFIFFILFPYVTTQNENKEVTMDLKNITRSAEQTQSLFDTFQQIRSSYDKLRDRISFGPTELLEGVQIESNRISNPQYSQTPQLDPKCENKLSDTNNDGVYSASEKEGYLNCYAEVILQAMLGKYVGIAHQGITLPLQSLGSDYANSFDPAALENALKELQEPTIKTIQANPGFWKSEQGKGNIFFEV